MVLYDKDNQVITNTDDLRLTMNLETVDVTIPVSPKKTVSLVASTLHQPKGFSQSRIQIEPAEITIAGASDVLSGISEIQLDQVIDFAQLKAGTTNLPWIFLCQQACGISVLWGMRPARPL